MAYAGLGALQMFNGFNSNAPMPPSEAELATQALNDEAAHRFRAFTAGDAVTLGLSLRKRFRATSRHGKGKGLVLSVQSSQAGNGYRHGRPTCRRTTPVAETAVDPHSDHPLTTF